METDMDVDMDPDMDVISGGLKSLSAPSTS
jgi:hypothetical protein